jgi:hypothetical protein
MKLLTILFLAFVVFGCGQSDQRTVLEKRAAEFAACEKIGGYPILRQSDPAFYSYLKCDTTQGVNNGR